MDLNKIRKDIDRIDSTMKPLFIERMACGEQVAMAKAESGGDVYAPVREAQVIAARTADVDPIIRGEYEAFLLHLMSLNRRYEYGLLPEMQERTLDEVLAAAGLSRESAHGELTVTFACEEGRSNLNLVINMISLNKIALKNLSMESADGLQQVTATLVGNVNEGNMKQLLCQLAKETKEFAIKELK